MDGGPPNQGNLLLFPLYNPLSGFRDLLLSPCVRREGSPGPALKLTGGETGMKDRAAREGCRAGTAASCPGPGPALGPLRSQNSIFHLFSCNGDVFLHFCF